MVWDKRVPFSEFNQLIDEGVDKTKVHEWRDNWIFRGTLFYMGYRTLPGQVVKFRVRLKEQGIFAWMFPKDFDTLLTQRGLPSEGVVADWTFVKRSRGFGIMLIDVVGKGRNSMVGGHNS